MNRSLAAGAAASLAMMGWLATNAAADKGAPFVDGARTSVSMTATVTVSPRSATPGSPVAVSGAGCSGAGARVVVDFGTDVEGDFSRVGRRLRFTPETDGQWSGTLVVPKGLVPGPNYAVHAGCHRSDHHHVDYRRAPFEVRLARAPRPAAAVLAPPGFTG